MIILTFKKLIRAYFNNRIYRYAGDCDITFFLGNIKGGIKDFQVSAKATSIKDIFRNF